MRHILKPVLAMVLPVLVSCGGAQGGPATATAGNAANPGYSPTWVLLTIDSARIAATPPSAASWDPADTTPTIKDTAENLASLLSFATQEGGMVAQALASLIPDAQPDSDVTLPDPQVAITYNETVANRRVLSPRASDTLQPTWGYAFFARIDNLRDRGLEFEVIDDDDGRQERIALVNVPRSLLQQVITSGISQTADLSDAALEQLRVRVEPVAVHVPAAVQHFALPLRQGLIATHVAVPRGAVITVRVSGSGKVGNGGLLGLGCPTDVTPAGLPDGACRDDNLSGMPELQSSAHGSAVALIGRAPDIHAVSLANGNAASTCVRFAAPAYGELVFAINDRDSTDNDGEFSFDLEVAPPPEAPTDVSESPADCR